MRRVLQARGLSLSGSCIGSAFLVILFTASVSCNPSEKEYPPGYIGALNSTIENLMAQLKTYQAYIDQAFVPLTTYDQVFEKPLSKFETQESEPVSEVEEEVPDVAARLNDNAGAGSTPKSVSRHEDSPADSSPKIRRTKKRPAHKSPSSDTAQDDQHPESVQFTKTEDDFDDSDTDGVIRKFDVRQGVKSKRKFAQNLLTKDCGIYDPSLVRLTDGDGHVLWPWSVTLGKEVGVGFLYKCGGTLITLQHIITSANCLQENNEVNTARMQGVKVRVAETHIHPNYHEGLGYNDIAIVKLVKPLNETSVREPMPICLVPPNEHVRSTLEKVGGFSWTTEWKYSNKDKRLRMIIRNTYMKIQPTPACEAKYKEVLAEDELTFFSNGFNSSLICVKSSRKDVCQKSAGISLMTRERSTERAYLLGVVVKGEDSCISSATGEDGELPGIYTRVSHFIDWIFDTIVPQPEPQGEQDAKDSGSIPEDKSYYYYES